MRLGLGTDCSNFSRTVMCEKRDAQLQALQCKELFSAVTAEEGAWLILIVLPISISKRNTRTTYHFVCCFRLIAVHVVSTTSPLRVLRFASFFRLVRVGRCQLKVSARPFRIGLGRPARRHKLPLGSCLAPSRLISSPLIAPFASRDGRGRARPAGDAMKRRQGRSRYDKRGGQKEERRSRWEPALSYGSILRERSAQNLACLFVRLCGPDGVVWLLVRLERHPAGVSWGHVPASDPGKDGAAT